MSEHWDVEDFLRAAEDGDIQGISDALNSGLDIDARDRDLFTPLMIAAETNDGATQYLLEHGADANARNVWGNTPLMFASQNGETASINVLLQHGADANLTNEKGETALMWAVHSGEVSAVDAFLNHGADVTIRDVGGRTALTWALENWTYDESADTIAHLLTAGPPLSVFDVAMLGRLDQLSQFLESGTDVNARDVQNMTLLMKVALGGFTNIVQYLLDHGADVNATDTDGMTALMWAGDSLEIVVILLDNGAAIDQRDLSGHTAFCRAVRYRQIDLCKLLLSRGVDPTIGTNDKSTPLQIADSAGSTEIADLIRASM